MTTTYGSISIIPDENNRSWKTARISDNGVTIGSASFVPLGETYLNAMSRQQPHITGWVEEAPMPAHEYVWQAVVNGVHTPLCTCLEYLHEEVWAMLGIINNERDCPF